MIKLVQAVEKTKQTFHLPLGAKVSLYEKAGQKQSRPIICPDML